MTIMHRVVPVSVEVKNYFKQGGRRNRPFTVYRLSSEMFVDYMEPKGEESPPTEEEGSTIPTGWDVKLEVQKNGSIKRSYYCPDTGQHFYTYPNLMRYVNYAKRYQVGAYHLCGKSIRRREDEALKKNNFIGRRKTSAALSIRGRPPRPSNSDSLAASKNNGSKPSSSDESTDDEKDVDYIPEQDAGVSTHFCNSWSE